jgi:hypothetical protein
METRHRQCSCKNDAILLEPARDFKEKVEIVMQNLIDGRIPKMSSAMHPQKHAAVIAK